MKARAATIDRPQSDRQGIALMVTAIVMFGVMDTAVKYLAQDYPVLQVTWARYTFHALLFLGIFGGLRPGAMMSTTRPWLQLTRGILLLAATAMFFTALHHLPLTEAIAIGFVSPFFVTALSIPILKEKVGIRRWAAILVGFVGVLIIIRPGSGAMHWAAILPIGMAFCFALYQILTRIAQRTEDARTSLFYTSAVGVVVMTGVVLAADDAWRWPDVAGWALMVGVGFLGGFGHYLVIKAYERAQASVLSPFVYTQMLWMTILGYVLFDHFPDRYTWIGATIVIGSGLYIWARETRRAKG